MSDINRITIVGNVGQTPEYKYFESGSYLTKFSIACNRYDSKTKADVTEWFNIETFSKLGEFIQQGNKLAIDGRLRADSWQDEQGNTKKRVYIFADTVQILTPKKQDDEMLGTDEVSF